MTAPECPAAAHSAEIVRLADYEQRSRAPDAVSPRDPAESAVIIILPMVRVERYAEPKHEDTR